MAIPDYQSIMLPLLKLAGDNEIHQVHDAVTLLAQEFDLTDEERQERIPSGRVSRFHNNVTWARTYMKKAGLLEDPKKGQFRITDRGRKVVADEPEIINSKFLQQFDEFNVFIGRKQSSPESAPPDSSLTPEQVLHESYQTLRNSLAADLLEQVQQASPAFFERLVVDVLVDMGYGGSRREAGEAIGQSGDEGIDGIVKEDRLGLDIIYIQAKRWANTVGRPEVQKFAGALAGKRARKGIFIATSSFSSEAIAYAAKIDTKIVLIPGTQLADLMIDHGVGVTTEATYELKRIDADYFLEE
jgi:restriction system protein